MTDTMTRSREASLLSIEQEVGAVVRRVRRVLHERARTTHPDISAAAYLVLLHLDSNGACRSAELSEVLGIDKGAISRQVSHLIELGLVRSAPDPDDGRAHLLEITDECRRRLQDTAIVRRKLLDENLGGWSAADLDGFVSGLKRYNASLDK